jgi:hypothetical protein
MSHMYSWVTIRVDREYEPLISRTDNRIIARVTS